MAFQSLQNANKHMVALVELHGEIGKTLTYESVKDLIDRAFEVKSVDSVVLEINSPGGSPSQTEQITNYIKEKSLKMNIPVYSFVMDQALSGGYWIACAGTLIYACGKLSTLGSIGVKIETMSFRGIMDRLGIEMDTVTSGEKKAQFDDVGDAETRKLQKHAEKIHKTFISAVESSRSDKLTKNAGVDPFNGGIWLAEEAMKMGLIDGIESFDSFAMKVFGKTAKVVRVKESIFKLDLSDIIVHAIKKFA